MVPLYPVPVPSDKHILPCQPSAPSRYLSPRCWPHVWDSSAFPAGQGPSSHCCVGLAHPSKQGGPCQPGVRKICSLYGPWDQLMQRSPEVRMLSLNFLSYPTLLCGVSMWTGPLRVRQRVRAMPASIHSTFSTLSWKGPCQATWVQFILCACNQ